MIEIVFVLDRSGSMSGHQDDVIGGVNTLLDSQREAGVNATVSMFKFDTEFDEICRHVPLAEAHLNAEDYVPRGATALMDAVGKTINMMGEDYNKHMTSPDGVMFVIFTDGYENASREFKRQDIKHLITQQESQWNWEFVYMGAEVDAFAEAISYGMKTRDARGYSKARSFAKTREAFQVNYADLSSQTTAFAESTNSISD